MNQLPESAIGVPKALIALRSVINTKAGLLRCKKRFMEKVMPEPNTGCWIWTAHLDSAGYGRFNVGRGGIELRAHRVSYELYNSSLLNGMLVCHKCDNKFCVNPDHLFLGTHVDNMVDRDTKGRCQKGQTHVRAKLTNTDVLVIREAYKAGFKISRISEYFKMNRATICQVVHRQIWKHI